MSYDVWYNVWMIRSTDQYVKRNTLKSVSREFTLSSYNHLHTAWHWTVKILDGCLCNVIPRRFNTHPQFNCDDIRATVDSGLYGEDIGATVWAIISHTCLVGDKLSDQAGQGRNCASWSQRKPWTIRATWGWVLSCWNTLPRRIHKRGRTAGSRTSVMYHWVFGVSVIHGRC